MRPFLTVALLVALPLGADDIGLLKASLSTLNRGGEAAKQEAKRQSPADALAMRLPVAGTPWGVKSLAAEWLLKAHLLRRKEDPSASPDGALEKAWELAWVARSEARNLQMTSPGANLYRGSDAKTRAAAAAAVNDSIKTQDLSTEVKAALDALPLEIAVRLEDPQKMALAAEAVSTRPSLPERDRAYAFLASAHAGRWADVLRWGTELEAGGKLLASYHARALEQAEAVDYAALLAWVRATRPQPAADFPPSQVFEVTKFRLKLREASGPGSEAIRQAYPEGWQDAAEPGSTLLRIGALAHWQRPAQRPMPLTGGAGRDRLDLYGFLDSPSGARRTERLEAKADATRPGWWTGRWSLEGKDAKGGVLKADFDLELQLAPKP